MKFFTKFSKAGTEVTVLEVAFHELTLLRGRFVGQFALTLGGGIFSSWVTKKEWTSIKRKFPADYLPMGWEYFKPNTGLITVITEVKENLSEEDYLTLLEVEMANLRHGTLDKAANEAEPCGTYSHSGVSFFLTEEEKVASDVEVGKLYSHMAVLKAQQTSMLAEAEARSLLDTGSSECSMEILSKIRDKRIPEQRYQSLLSRVAEEKLALGIED
jgi:hypothetical protein